MSTIAAVENVDRGYERIEQKLTALGGHVRRVEAEEEPAPAATG
jgi:UDP-N-acetylglucosamine enolpyruvyl transferase